MEAVVSAVIVKVALPVRVALETRAGIAGVGGVGFELSGRFGHWRRMCPVSPQYRQRWLSIRLFRSASVRRVGVDEVRVDGGMVAGVATVGTGVWLGWNRRDVWVG